MEAIIQCVLSGLLSIIGMFGLDAPGLTLVQELGSILLSAECPS